MSQKRRRADVFVEEGEDPRGDAAPTGDERTTLIDFLRWQRETLELKCSGLGPDDLARRSVEPSTLSLLGLVRHMADVEHGWFRRTMAGEDSPPPFESEASPDAAFDGAVANAVVVEEAWAAWREQIAFAERFVDQAADLAVTSRRADPWRGPMSLRWVLIHMIEEYARHNGHADLLRERIDGRLGQ